MVLTHRVATIAAAIGAGGAWRFFLLPWALARSTRPICRAAVRGG